ncbi:MAG TPA: LLM class flavin-dependent oxidoreductase [Actinomycetota bacterium]|nr:LLM class flavin-dependent oxidoreductase [Actinomycetota bacterium]
MTELAVNAQFPGLTARDALDVVRRAWDWGYRAAWGAEVDGPDAFTILGALAATTDYKLGVGVVPVQTRTVYVIGMSAVSMAQLSGGRFALGVGASSEVLVSRFGGQPFDRPLTNLREAVEALRPILRGERSTYDGRYVKIGGYKTPTPPPAPVPLYLGSLNPKSLRMAGELGDGLCINQIAPHHVQAMLDEVRAGAKEAGRELPSDFPVMARLFCLVTDDAPAARSILKMVFAPYVATSVYNRFYRWMGYEEEAEAIAAAAKAKDRDAMAKAFSDRIAEDLFVVGTAGEVVGRLREYVEAGVTIPVVAPLASDTGSAAETLKSIGESW